MPELRYLANVVSLVLDEEKCIGCGRCLEVCPHEVFALEAGKAQIADLDGTIVPAYLLNSALGNIPVIGELFTGGEGQGIFAATYSVRGPIDDAEITVNPLAALAPGILRDVFLIFDRAPAAEAVPAEAAGQQLDGIGGSPSNDSLETLNGVAGPTGRSNISR